MYMTYCKYNILLIRRWLYSLDFLWIIYNKVRDCQGWSAHAHDPEMVGSSQCLLGHLVNYEPLQIGTIGMIKRNKCEVRNRETINSCKQTSSTCNILIKLVEYQAWLDHSILLIKYHTKSFQSSFRTHFFLEPSIDHSHVIKHQTRQLLSITPILLVIIEY